MDDLAQLRNIGVAAHIDAGKTTTTERILYYSGAVHKMGNVDDGTTVTDFDPEEQQRGITIYSAAVSFTWRDCRVNLIDTPGHVDFTAEVERSLRVLDGAIIVFDAHEGVEAQSETVWRQADKYHVPRICFINKMDKVGADFHNAVGTVRDRLHANPVPVQLPIGQESTFRGVIDLVEMKAIIYRGGDGRDFAIEDIPADLLEDARHHRHALEERVAEVDDGIMHKYLAGEEIEPGELRAALRRGTISLQLQPVFAGSSLRYMGVQRLLDGVCDYLPSPRDIPSVSGHDPDKPDKVVRRKCDPGEPLCALVFKIVAESHGDLYFIRVYSGELKAGSRITNVGRRKKENLPRIFRIFAKRREQIDKAGPGEIVAAIGLKESLTGDTITDGQGAGILLEKIEFPESVISMAIEPKSSGDRDKMLAALAMLVRGDPTFQFRANPETGQTLISGMGELHLEVRCHNLERDFNVPVRVGRPRVAYRETITRAAEARGRFQRQIGGKEQFAGVTLRVEPFEPQAGQENFQFVSALPEGRMRAEFLPAVQTGARDAGRSGVLGGYPLINVRCTLLDAEDHPDSSSEIAFESAAAHALQQAIEAAGPVLLEPIMKVEVVTPEDYFGAINGDLMSRRAIIHNTSLRGRNHVIDAEVPLSAMFGYATQVRSLSQGRASYAMEPSRYEAMPPNLAQQVLGVI